MQAVPPTAELPGGEAPAPRRERRQREEGSENPKFALFGFWEVWKLSRSAPLKSESEYSQSAFACSLSDFGFELDFRLRSGNKCSNLYSFPMETSTAHSFA